MYDNFYNANLYGRGMYKDSDCEKIIKFIFEQKVPSSVPTHSPCETMLPQVRTPPA